MHILLLLLFGLEVILFVPTRAQNNSQYVIRDGDEVEIKCSPGNTNGSTITWDVPDKLSNLTISRNSSLIVGNPRTSSLQGSVNVSCVAISSYNGSNQTNATITEQLYQIVLNKVPKIANKKSIYDVPDDGSVEAILSCDANGFPSPTTRWIFNNDTLNFVNSTNTANSNWTVLSDGRLKVMSSNRGGGFGINVVCFANNSEGTSSRNFLVRFLKAPKILTNRSDVALFEDQVRQYWLQCKTIGYPKPFINWIFGQFTLNVTGGVLTGATVLGARGPVVSSYRVSENGALLIINPLYKESVPYNRFTCVASSFLGNDSIPHTFSIGADGKRLYVVRDGDEAEIECSPSNPNKSITWDVPDELSNITISQNSSLIVRNPRTSSLQGLVNVTCVASNSNNGSNLTNKTTTERKLYQVVLYKAPKITSKKSIYDVADNGSVEAILKCDTNGFPSPSIQWTFNNVSLSAEKTFLVNSSDAVNANLSVMNDGRLKVMSSNREGGFGVNVLCLVKNTEGDTNETFLVRFLKAPKILNPASDVAIPKKKVEQIRIPCQTIGYPGPFIYWVFGTVTLNVTSGVRKGQGVLDESGVVHSSFQVFENGTLRIDNPLYAEHVPYDNFTCVASSFLGEDRVVHKYSVGALMSFPFEITLANASQFGANRSDIVKKIESVFKNGLAIRSTEVKRVDIASGEVEFVLTWLEQRLKAAEYIKEEKLNSAALAKDVRQRLIDNGVGVTKFFMDAKPGPATNLAVDDVTETEVTFSWKKPLYFNIDEYQIQLKEGGSKWINSKTVPGDKTTADLDGLDEGTKYLIRLQSIHKGRTGDYESQAIEVKTDEPVPVTVIVVVVVLVVLVVIAVIMAVMYYHRRKKYAEVVEIIPLESGAYMFSLPGVHTTNIYERDHRTFCPYDGGNFQGGAESSEKEYFSWREIPRDSLNMKDELGQGEFGMVMKAIWVNQENNVPLPVAVKTIKDTATENDRKELFKELRLMSEISDHPNIVKMIGACSKEGPLWIVVELCEHGNLLSFLRKNRKEISGRQGDYTSALDPLLRVRIAYDVSKGMRYLEDKKIVHRDLAARNVLLGKNKIAKIADFGLSRDIYDDGIYHKTTGGKLPIKWMAIESLNDQSYDTKSDVWAFGIVFWEIETAGMVPYPGIGGRELLGHLLNGFRMNKPDETPFEIYDIMTKCWEASPKVRPRFADIEAELEAYLEQRSDYLPVLIEDDPADDEEAYVNYIFGVEDEEDPNK